MISVVNRISRECVVDFRREYRTDSHEAFVLSPFNYQTFYEPYEEGISVMASTSSAPNSTSEKPRSSAERAIVWGAILVLGALVGFEFFVKRSYESAEKTLMAKLTAADNDTKSATRLTNKDIPALLGNKKPAHAGKTGQLYLLNSNYYEAYVWPSLLKRKFVAPPEEPEMLNMYAVYSGEVRPEKVKHRTKGYDKNIEDKPGFFHSYVLYIYYSAADKNGVREVLDIRPDRVPYHDDIRTPPDAEELKKRHEQNLARAIADSEKFGAKLTPEQKEKMDTWKYPPPDTNDNMKDIPNWDPVTNSFKTPPAELPATSDDGKKPEPAKAPETKPEPRVKSQDDRRAPPKDELEQPVKKPAEKSADKPAEKPVDKPAEKTETKPADKPVAKPADKPEPKPVDKPVEKPADKPAATKPEEKPADKPADTKPADTKTKS